MGKTKIFISSTCYDLSQSRQDLKDYIMEMGHIPIMSENMDFPINPMESAQENCIEAVKKEADVFVLVIGNRYGYKLESGKSITNLEFLAAVQKGIPIYTFTVKKMIHVLPLWRKNPTSDFSEYVDDTRIFEFIEDVRSKRGLWNFEFETAQDIKEIIKSQLSILLNESLSERLALKASSANDYLSNLSGEALNILLKKSDSFEMRLFLQMMSDEIKKYVFEKNDCNYSIFIKKGVILDDVHSCTTWQSEKLDELEKVVDMLNNLFSAYEHYYGEPGVPSDIKGLYYVALRYGELYRYLLHWVMDVKSAVVCEECKDMVAAFAELPMNVISQLEKYPDESLAVIERSLEEARVGKLPKGSTVNVALRLTMGSSAQKRFHEEVGKLKTKYGITQ